MIIRPQLQKFTDDAKLQQTIVSEVRHAVQQWKNHEISKAHRAYILKAGGAATPQNCIKHLKPLFSNLSWLYEMVDKLCQIQSKNPFTNIELRSSKSENYSKLILHQERKFSINLCIAKSRNAQHISSQNNFVFGPDMMMVAPINDAQIIKAQLDSNDNILKHEIESCNGRPLYIYNNRLESMNFVTQDKDIIFLRAIIKTGAFDDCTEKISHHYLQFNGDNRPQKHLADETLSRAQLILSILRHQNTKRAIPLFEEWVRNDAPDMRWYVMREFLAMDMKAALPHLSFMSEYDDSRCVRKAALDTLHILRVQYPEVLDVS